MEKEKVQYLFPHFILADRNGWAIAKALEAGLDYMAARVQEGYETLTDVEKMPEWRLDEVAWEENLVYNNSGDVEEKRQYVRNHDKDLSFSVYGTPYSLKQYIKGVEKDAVVQEWWEYGADPYHFKVEVDGRIDITKNQWAAYVIENVKNVRSVFDGIRYSDDNFVKPVYAGIALIGAERGEFFVKRPDVLPMVLDNAIFGVLDENVLG